MDGKMVLHFGIILLLSVNMYSCQKKTQKVKKTLSNASGDKKVKVTNWQKYGWKSDQEVDAKVLVKILNSLALYERGEACPFGEGKCESLSSVSVLTKLIREMLNVKKTSEDCEKTGDCDPNNIKDIKKPVEIIENSKTPKEAMKQKYLKKGLAELSTDHPHNTKLLFVSLSHKFLKSKLFSR